LRNLQKNNGKPLTRHYSAGLPAVSLPKNRYVWTEGARESIDGNLYYPWALEARTTWDDRPQYTATMRFRYKLPDMSQVSNQIKAWLDALGVRPNAAIVWNAIPFSFLVDWIVGVGDWLESLSTDNLEIPVTIEDFCHSVKYSTRVEIVAHEYNCIHEVVCSEVKTYYKRVRTVPYLSLPALHTKGLSGRKVLLATSLVTGSRK